MTVPLAVPVILQVARMEFPSAKAATICFCFSGLSVFIILICLSAHELSREKLSLTKNFFRPKIKKNLAPPGFEPGVR